MTNCPHCGMIHQTTCPRIRAIDYNPDGSVKRIEFHAPMPLSVPPQPLPITILDGPVTVRGSLVSNGEQAGG